MNTIEQPEAAARDARQSTSGSGARPDMVDVVLLLATIVALMSAAAGIAIGFPLALEIVSTQAHAAMAIYPAPQGRPLHRHQDISAHRVGRSAPPAVASPDTGAPAPPLGTRSHFEPEEESEEYDEPLIVDDVRSEERMYAAAGIASSIGRSAPAASANDDPEPPVAMKDRRRDAGEHEGSIPSF